VVKGKLRRLRRQGRTGSARGIWGPIGDLLRPGQNLAGHGLPGNRLRYPSATPFPRSSLRGVSIEWLRRNRPQGWKEMPTRNREGFVWRDENGVERLRFMRPTGENPANNDWSRQANGYFRWQSSQSAEGPGDLFLDVDGNIVPRDDLELFNERTHIVYEGPWP
jgi:hypothetical protein